MAYFHVSKHTIITSAEELTTVFLNIWINRYFITTKYYAEVKIGEMCPLPE
jgi:hypothetical protein